MATTLVYSGFRRNIDQVTSGIKQQYSTVKQIDVIRESLFTILTTRRGERLMDPNFGSRLPELVFDPNDPTLETLAKEYAKEAIQIYEDRVILYNVTTFNDEHELKIVVEYSIIPELSADQTYVATLGLSLGENGLTPIDTDNLALGGF